jgi:hypothetical protein
VRWWLRLGARWTCVHLSPAARDRGQARWRAPDVLSPRSAHNHIEWVGGQGHYDLGYAAAIRSHGRERGWTGMTGMPFILRGTPPGTAMICRERRVTGPRFRYIVAGERGAVEYVTLAGFPLAISHHSPQALDGFSPCPATSLKAPAAATGRSSPAGSCASAGARPTRTRSSAALWETGTPGGREPCAPLPHLVLPGNGPCRALDIVIDGCITKTPGGEYVARSPSIAAAGRKRRTCPMATASPSACAPAPS